MLCCDYSFYTDVYGGNAISAEDWKRVSRDAMAYIDFVTHGRINGDLSEEVLERVKFAVCAVADSEQYDKEGGDITHEIVGNWTRIYARKSVSQDKRKMSAAERYLASTGLMYGGACIV